MRHAAAGALAALVMMAVLHDACAVPPKGWRQPRSGSHLTEVGVDRRVVRTGKASAFIRATRPEPAAFGVCRQWIRADRYRGKRLRVSAYLKTQDVGPTKRSGARLDLFVFSETHRFGGATMRGRIIQGTTPWTRYEHVIDVPREAVLLAIDVVLAGPGQLWVDDVKIEVVGGDVATTATCDRQSTLDEEMQQRIRMRRSTAPKKPVNLNFEQ